MYCKEIDRLAMNYVSKVEVTFCFGIINANINDVSYS